MAKGKVKKDYGDSKDKEKALELALLSLEKEFGKGVVIHGDSNAFPEIGRIPSGSISLDKALNGGYARGRIIELLGLESCGKTSYSLHAIAECQKLGGMAAFLDLENALDLHYASALGVDINRLLISQPECGEEALNIADRLTRSGAVDLIVVDSVAALVPRVELEGQVGDSSVGLQARMMSQAMRMLVGPAKKTNTAIIFINQLRSKIGVMYGPTDTTCVSPDTMVEIEIIDNINLVSMENLFRIAGVDYKTLKENTVVDIEDKNIYIKCFDHAKNENTKRKIKKLIRKQDTVLYEVRTNDNDVLLKASPDHMIYDPERVSYISLRNYKTGHVLLKNGQVLPVIIVKTNIISPILDVEIDGVNNYFSNSLLSHNSGGNALKYYASQRLDIRRIETLQDGDDKTGIRSRIKVVKNKVGPPFKQTELNIMFGKGIDWAADLFDLAISNKLIERNGVWFSYNGSNIGQGTANACATIREKKELANELKQKLTEVILPSEVEEDIDEKDIE